MFKIAIFLSGRGSNFKTILKHIEEKSLPIEVCLVLSDKKKAAGLEHAKEAGIPTEVVPRRVKEQSLEEFNFKLAETTLKYQPDLVVLAGFMRVLSSEFISKFENKIINIHPSLLPAYPGLNVQQRAIDAGEKVSGCTVHYVVEEVDAGPIIDQISVPILEGDTAETLAARILEQEHILYPRVVEKLALEKTGK